jgi:hypothetical protein
VNIIEKAGGIISRAPHREGKHNGYQENADGIIPIKKLEAIALNAFVSVGP